MFCVLLKIIERVSPTKGKDEILDAILNRDLLDKLRIMHAFKPHLKVYTELLIYLLCQSPAYYRILKNELKFDVTSPNIYFLVEPRY